MRVDVVRLDAVEVVLGLRVHQAEDGVGVGLAVTCAMPQSSRMMVTACACFCQAATDDAAAPGEAPDGPGRRR